MTQTPLHATIPAVVCGVDVAKDSLAASLIDATGRVVWSTTVRNQANDIGRLLRRLPDESAVVIEPTGSYGRPLASACRATGHRCLLAPTRAARDFLRSLGGSAYGARRAKNDRLDSEGLARYAQAVPLREYPLPTPVIDELSQLLKARRQLSLSLGSLHQSRLALPLAASVLQSAIDVLTAERRRLDAQIGQLVAAHEQLAAVRALQAVPGVGPVVAAAVTACLASREFPRADSFVAYCGLDPTVCESGTRGAGTGGRRLSKQGDAELRRLLFCAAQAATRTNGSPFKEPYLQDRSRGLAPTAAFVIVARRLARLCWSMHQHRSAYDPARVFGPAAACRT